MIAGKLKNNIRKLRFEHGEMTQKELAQQVDCTRQTINAIEAAKYGPSLELAFKIAHVFGIGIQEVFQYEVTVAEEDIGDLDNRRSVELEESNE
jgi:putative transcriptional regulator